MKVVSEVECEVGREVGSEEGKRRRLFFLDYSLFHFCV